MPPKKIKHDWSWVEEVKDVDGITDEHRLRAAGLTDLVQCTFTFPVIEGGPLPVKERKCNVGYCETNPACYNYVEAKELLDPEGKRKYVDDKLDNRTTSRKEGIPAGLRNLGATCYVSIWSSYTLLSVVKDQADRLGKRLSSTMVPQYPLSKRHLRLFPSRRLSSLPPRLHLRITPIYRETICRPYGPD